MRNAEVAKPITTQKLIAKTDLACVSVVSVCDCVNSVTAPKMAAPLAVAFLFVALLAPSKAQLSLSIEEQSLPLSSVTLEVLVSRNISLVLGRSYQIDCVSNTGFGGQQNVWSHSGSQVPIETVQLGLPPLNTTAVYSSLLDPNDLNEWSLVLQVFNESAVGSYTCSGGGENSATFVIGTSNPAVIASTPLLTVRAGGTPNQRASITAFISPPITDNSQITWTFNGSPVLPAAVTELGNEILLPQVVPTSVEGTYTCTVVMGQDTASAVFMVVVAVQPSVTISPSTLQVQTSGSTFTVTCTDSNGSPPPSFTWSHTAVGTNLTTQLSEEGGEEGRTIVPSPSQSVLILGALRREDAGEYRCTAVNFAGSNFGIVSLEVQHVPILAQHSTQTQWVVGSTATIAARLTASNPPFSSARWLRGDSPLPSSSSSQEEVGGSTIFTLTLSSVGLEDEGNYTLEAVNTIGTGTVDIEVVVIVPPVLTPAGDAPIVYAATDSSPSLSFTISEAKPPVMAASDISLVSQPQQILASVSYDADTSTAAVRLDMVRRQNSGSYRVQVQHPAGTVDITFDLRVRDPPSPPASVSATPFSPCQATFSWPDPPLPDSTNTSLPADYAVVEVMLQEQGGGGGTGGWLEAGRTADPSERSLVAYLPGSGPDSMYLARIRSGSNRIGEGPATLSPQTYTAYPDGQFLAVSNAHALPSATPTQLHVSWSLPASDCFSFVSYRLSCAPTTDQAARSGGLQIPSEESLAGDVIQLTPDTQYDCTVFSTVTDRVRRSFTHETSSLANTTFTFPDFPAVPEQPKLPPAVPPTVATITVEFAPPTDPESISHYQVIVLRLSSKESLPSTSPDALYPYPTQFASYSDVHPSEEQPSGRAGMGEEVQAYIAAELSAEDFTTTFTIGSKSMDAAGYFNGELAGGTVYSCFLRAFPRTLQQLPPAAMATPGGSRKRRQTSLSARQYAVFSSSPFLDAISTEPPPRPPTGGISPGALTGIYAAVGIVMAILVITALVLAAFLLAHRYLARRHRPQFPHSPSVEDSSVGSERLDDFKGTDTPDLIRRGVPNGTEMKELNFDPKRADCVPSGPIAREDFVKHVEKFDSNRQLLFQEEFEWITAKSPWRPAEASEHRLNDEKNRYSNITAFDHSRVRLSEVEGGECSDYINANFIAGHKAQQQYISSQGPLEQTVVDFWRMVWEQKVATIIMLTNLVELGKIKCSQYWPNSDSVRYGDHQVTLEHSVVLPDYTIRSLTVQSVSTTECRRVLQFHYTQWPDYGTPKLAAPLLNFLRAVHSSNPGSSGPLLVHCSAGVGRSGTVLCVDHCLQQMQEDNVVDIRGFVSGMREQRNYMVQTEQQYVFIHYTVLEALVYGDTSFPLSSFASNYKHLQEVSPVSGRTLLEEEYHRLGTVKTMVKKSSFQQKVKQKGAPPRHFNSSFISHSGSGTMWYNAHFIDSYFEPRLFVVADGPSLESAARFWQMVWDEDCSYIVMLTPLDTEYYGYWPARGAKDQHGNVVVEVEEEMAEHLYTCRKIRLTNAKGTICHTVKQYQFIGWTTQFLPPVPTFVSFVCDILKGVESLDKNQRLLLHDTSSLGPSGIFTSLCYCIARLRVERVVDVFQTVQCIQLQRPGMVESMQQYAFIYDCVYEFIRTHSNT